MQNSTFRHILKLAGFTAAEIEEYDNSHAIPRSNGLITHEDGVYLVDIGNRSAIKNMSTVLTEEELCKLIALYSSNVKVISNSGKQAAQSRISEFISFLYTRGDNSLDSWLVNTWISHVAPSFTATYFDCESTKPGKEERSNDFTGLKVLALMMRSYPYGGGEAYMVESSQWLRSSGAHVVLASFKDSDYKPLVEHKLEQLHGIPCIGFANIADERALKSSIEQLIHIFKPDFIHIQGEINELVVSLIEPWWPPILAGYHFWTGLVRLKDNSNVSILGNIEAHQLHSSFVQAIRSRKYKYYVASRFMSEVLIRLGLPKQPKILNPIAIDVKQDRHSLISPWNPSNSKILQVNCSLLKGGILFVLLAIRFDHLCFEGRCASHIELLELYQGLDDRTKRHVKLERGILYINQNSRVVAEYIHETDRLYANSAILLVPSIVDETFCRVVVEGVQRGVPVLASCNGNLPYIVPPSEILPTDNIDAWAESIQRLTEDERLRIATLANQKDYIKKSITCGREEFLNYIETELMGLSGRRNIVIVCPWSEQGLGYHAKIYVQVLESQGYIVHVLSFQAYQAKDFCHAIQTNPEDWKHPRIYYSLNSRETLTAYEVIQFCTLSCSSILIWLEICWEANWKRLYEVKKAGINIVIVPNPETLSKQEVLKLNDFPLILATTKLCYSLLLERGIRNVSFIGHFCGFALDSKARQEKALSITSSKKIHLIHVAGYNHARKMTVETIQELAPLIADADLFELTVLSQVPFSAEAIKCAQSAAGINLIAGSFPSDVIRSRIHESSISLQLSTHEGLGLGIYESISLGVPVVVVDCQPQNEHVIPGKTGLIIPGSDMDLYDNPNALITGSVFKKGMLASALRNITLQQVALMSEACFEYADTVLSQTCLATRLSNAVKRLT